VIATLIDKIRDGSPHGGFVKQDFHSGQWFEIGLERARDKVGHAVRKAADALIRERQGKGKKSSKAKGTLLELQARTADPPLVLPAVPTVGQPGSLLPSYSTVGGATTTPTEYVIARGSLAVPYARSDDRTCTSSSQGHSLDASMASTPIGPLHVNLATSQPEFGPLRGYLPTKTFASLQQNTGTAGMLADETPRITTSASSPSWELAPFSSFQQHEPSWTSRGSAVAAPPPHHDTYLGLSWLDPSGGLRHDTHVSGDAVLEQQHESSHSATTGTSSTAFLGQGLANAFPSTIDPHLSAYLQGNWTPSVLPIDRSNNMDPKSDETTERHEESGV
jgi:hypothetical protein